MVGMVQGTTVDGEDGIADSRDRILRMAHSIAQEGEEWQKDSRGWWDAQETADNRGIGTEDSCGW